MNAARGAGPRPWLAIAIAAALVFFAVGLSHDADRIFSAEGWTFHVILRKSESIVAFFVVGYALDRATIERRRRFSFGTATLAIALYSGMLEIAQWLHGAQEGLGWNAVDVACGAIGGALADTLLVIQRRRAARARRPRRTSRA